MGTFIGGASDMATARDFARVGQLFLQARRAAPRPVAVCSVGAPGGLCWPCALQHGGRAVPARSAPVRAVKYLLWFMVTMRPRAYMPRKKIMSDALVSTPRQRALAVDRRDSEGLPCARKRTGAAKRPEPWGGAPQDGVWDGQRLLPEGWVRASTSPTRAFPQYGAGWWLDPPLWLPGAHAAPRRPRAILSGWLLVAVACRAGALGACCPAPVC